MAKPTPAVVYSIIERLDWTGHVELPMNDIAWLAREISMRLLNPDMDVCDACNTAKEVVVPTALGPICEDCIILARGAAAEAREQLES